MDGGAWTHGWIKEAHEGRGFRSGLRTGGVEEVPRKKEHAESDGALHVRALPSNRGAGLVSERRREYRREESQRAEFEAQRKYSGGSMQNSELFGSYGSQVPGSLPSCSAAEPSKAAPAARVSNFFVVSSTDSGWSSAMRTAHDARGNVASAGLGAIVHASTITAERPTARTTVRIEYSSWRTSVSAHKIWTGLLGDSRAASVRYHLAGWSAVQKNQQPSSHHLYQQQVTSAVHYTRHCLKCALPTTGSISQTSSTFALNRENTKSLFSTADEASEKE